MNKKKLVSLGIAAVFMALGTTGLLLYLVQHNKPTKVIHTTFGLFFVTVAVFHIINNWSSLVSYVKGKGVLGLNKEFFLISILAIVSVIGAGLLLPPFEQIEEFGEELRKGNRPPVKKVSFQLIETNQDLGGTPLSIQIEKNRETLLPSVAIWSIDSAGQFIDNLFAPANMLVVFTGEEGNEEHAIREGEVEPKPISDEILKTWKSQNKNSESNWKDVTPNESFILKSSTKASGSFSVMMEVSSMGKTELYRADLSPGSTAVKFKPVAEATLLSSGLIILN